VPDARHPHRFGITPREQCNDDGHHHTRDDARTFGILDTHHE
jgi:hypothetical protein